LPAFEEQTVRKIGRYEVIRKIATGGMAELYLARFVGPGGFEKRCALKRILPQFAADQTFTRMFMTEARVTAMFDHPNLVQVFELGQDEQGQFYIAMELVNGMNLRQLLHMTRERGVRVPPELAAYMVTQALDGLAYAHEFKDEDGQPQGLVHRDISPQNLLVSYEGAVKIVDFGIVKGSSISGETQAGMLKGKVAYMSPEQASGDPIDARSDLFSIGVCMYELIAGEKPFTGPNEIMCLKAILEHEPPPLTAFAPDCPEGLERAVYRALEKRRDLRYQSAREFQVEIHNVIRDCPMPLGRHVVSEFIKSFTEGTTDGFDSTKLRIPRTPGAVVRPPSVGFATNDSNVPLADPRSPSRSNGRGTLPAYVERTPSTSAPRTSPLVEGGLTKELRAAGLGSKPSPMVVMVFLASAIFGGLAVWLVTRDPYPVVIESMIEPSPPPVQPVTNVQAGQPVEPARPIEDRRPLIEPVVEEKKQTAAERKAAERAERAEREKAERAEKKAAKKERDRDRGERDRDRDRDRDKPVSGGGTLSLESVPRGLTVARGDDVIGKTPLSNQALPSGKHTLKLTNKALGISKTITVEIKRGERTEEAINVGRGTLKVLSRPWADVFINGVAKGKTPLDTPVYEGQHEVRLVNPEAGERIQKVDIKAGEDKEIKVRF
jgi:eukaryotic-like serine/threonine-protein kinase